MRKAIQVAILASAITAFGLAGPPGGGGHSSGSGSGYSSGGGGHVSASRHAMSGRSGGLGRYSGPPAISGPAPLGASGSAPLNSVGSLRPVYGFNGLASGRHGAGPGRRGNRSPYGYYPSVFPFFGYGYGEDGDGYYDNSYAPAPDYGPGPDQAPPGSDDALGAQVQQLNAEVLDLKYQQQQMQPGALPSAAAGSQAPDSEAQNEIPVTLVLHSGQQLQVKNYAVTDGTFWDFSKHPAQKIPVTAIDVPASEKATEASGGDFPPITQ